MARFGVLLALWLVAAGGTAALPTRAAAQSVKSSHLLAHVQKGGFSPEDREFAADYLAAHAHQLGEAPAEAEALLRSANRWVPELSRYGRPLPRRLERGLTPAGEGTVRLIFNRTLLLVSADDGAVLDRVFPR